MNWHVATTANQTTAIESCCNEIKIKLQKSKDLKNLQHFTSYNLRGHKIQLFYPLFIVKIKERIINHLRLKQMLSADSCCQLVDSNIKLSLPPHCIIFALHGYSCDEGGGGGGGKQV